MKSAALLLAALLPASPALAAGIDSHAYACAELHSLVAEHGFVFVGNPDFQDFVVADVSHCPGGAYNSYLQLRSVATRDNPECLVNYCVPPHGKEGDRQ
jgi:hypothetical protein